MERAKNIELPKLDEEFLHLSKVNDLQGFFQEKYTLSELKDMLEQSCIANKNRVCTYNFKSVDFGSS